MDEKGVAINIEGREQGNDTNETMFNNMSSRAMSGK